VKPRFGVYKAVSQQIREIFAEHTPIIEPLSLDEAYLDVTENLRNIPLARDVALAIRAKIKEVTGLNASETKLYRSANATRRTLLCPVLWVSRNGFVQIMRAAKPLTDMMSLTITSPSMIPCPGLSNAPAITENRFVETNPLRVNTRFLPLSR
jgi:hypothetical protein